MRKPGDKVVGVSDIREARTAQEVRDIMRHVNDRYNNTQSNNFL